MAEERYRHGRVTRRRVLRGAACTGAGLTAAAQQRCGKEEKPPVNGRELRADDVVFSGGQIDILRLSGEKVKEYIARQGPSYTPDWFKDVTISRPQRGRALTFPGASARNGS